MGFYHILQTNLGNSASLSGFDLQHSGFDHQERGFDQQTCDFTHRLTRDPTKINSQGW
jgi:hypothetical protein